MKKITIQCPKCGEKTFVVPLRDSELSSIGINLENLPEKLNMPEIEIRKGKCKNRKCRHSIDEDHNDLTEIYTALARNDFELAQTKMQILPPYLSDTYEYQFYLGCLNHQTRHYKIACETFVEGKKLLQRKMKRVKTESPFFYTFWFDYAYILSLIGTKNQNKVAVALRTTFTQLKQEQSEATDESKSMKDIKLKFYGLFEFCLQVLSMVSELKIKKTEVPVEDFEKLKRYFLKTNLVNLDIRDGFVDLLVFLNSNTGWWFSQFRIMLFFISSRLLQNQFVFVLQEITKQLDKEKKQKELEWFEQLVAKFVPTESNQLRNDFWYWPLKFKLNELYFDHFVSKGHLQEAFNYIETKGVDFVTIYAHDYLAIAPEDIPKPYQFTYADWGEMHGGLDQFEDMIDSNWYMPLKGFYLPARMYWEYLKNRSISELSGKQIKERILKLARQPGHDDYYIRITYPSFIGEIAEELLLFDEAIGYYENSNLNPTEKARAIDNCRFLRDGIRYEELRGVLRTLDEGQQRQLVAYSQIFSLETRLRRIVARAFERQLGTKKWWNSCVGGSPKEQCEKRYHKWRAYRESDISEVQTNMLDFSTLPELRDIIESNWAKVFKKLFLYQDQFRSILNLIEGIRNDIAHSRPLTVDQHDDLKKQISKLKARLTAAEKTLGIETEE